MGKKKKKVEQEQEQDLEQQEQDLEQQEHGVMPREWLLNPVVFSQISGDFTILQQRIMAGVLYEMQDKILRSINEKEEGKQFPSLFSDAEMMGDSTTIEISPRKLGIIPEHYDYLEESLKDLANKRIGFPKAYKDKMNFVVAPLFARLEIPMGVNRRTGKVKVVMLNENIRDFLSMDKGYTEYLTRITLLSKKVRTPRIYSFLASFKDAGHKKVDYKDFCKFLGIDDETARADRLNKINMQLKNGDITQKEANERLEALTKWENPFRKWNKVQSQILDPTKLELDTFSDNDQIDITFEYEALHEDGRKRGNPSHIQFTVIKKRLALEHDAEKRVSRQRHLWVRTMCDWCRDFRAYELREMIIRIRDEELDDFVNYCYRDVRDAVEHKQPDNVAAYAMTMMENYVKNIERKRDTIRQTEQQPADMFEVKEPIYDVGAGREQWEQLLTEYDGGLSDLLRRTAYLGLSYGMFYVQMSVKDADTFNSHEDRQALQQRGAELLGLKKGRPSIYIKKV